MKDIIDTLDKHNKKAYVVGGAVRDKLLGLQPEDVDITTDATPEELMKMFKHRNIGLVGATFGVVLVDDIEIATFRKDIYHKAGFSVSYAKTIEEDLARRDLTINAIAEDCITGKIVDPFGGRKDLKNNIIRFVGNGRARIKEDPCRILRACRFLAKLEGSFHPETLRALKAKAGMLRIVAPERIRLEIMKAMKLETPSLFFSAMHVIGGLRHVLPELEACTRCSHGTHHIETIFEHSMLAGDAIHPKFPVLRLAAFLHDIGKPAAFIQAGDGSFKQHEHIGSNLAGKRLKALTFTNEEIKTITGLIRLHMRPVRGLKPAAARRLRKVLYDRDVDPRDLIRLKLADLKANVKKDSKIKPSFVRNMLINAGVYTVEEDLPLTVKSLSLKGGEIIKHFGLEPGPLVGEIQRHLLSYVIENGEETNTFEELYEETKRYLNKL